MNCSTVADAHRAGAVAALQVQEGRGSRRTPVATLLPGREINCGTGKRLRLVTAAVDSLFPLPCPRTPRPTMRDSEPS
jgi:hypothetical protein